MTDCLPVTTRVVPDEAIPLELSVCLAKYEPVAGAALGQLFKGGRPLTKDLAGRYAAHLRHNHDLGARGLIWEAGPSADFTRYLGVYNTADLNAARKMFRDDPFAREGVLRDDWWRTWSVHTPYWKVSEPIRGMIGGLMAGMGIPPTD